MNRVNVLGEDGRICALCHRQSSRWSRFELYGIHAYLCRRCIKIVANHQQGYPDPRLYGATRSMPARST